MKHAGPYGRGVGQVEVAGDGGMRDLAAMHIQPGHQVRIVEAGPRCPFKTHTNTLEAPRALPAYDPTNARPPGNPRVPLVAQARTPGCSGISARAFEPCRLRKAFPSTAFFAAQVRPSQNREQRAVV